MVEAITKSCAPDLLAVPLVRRLSLEALFGDPDAPRLMRLHAEESTFEKQLDLQRDVYDFLEQSGSLFILGLYLPLDALSKKLVGYSVNAISPMLHHQDRLACQNNAIFVDWRYRERGLGRHLMRATAEEARARGASVILWSAKPNTRLARTADRYRWPVQDVVFRQELDHG